MKHGMTNTRLYKIYTNMKQRCYNPNSTKYSSYGGNGITICDEWLNDFQEFYNWAISNGYTEQLTIDRIDNSKGYQPDNCRWILFSENRKNRDSYSKEKDNYRIRQERIAKGWTQGYVGDCVGVTKTAIHDIETGKQKPSYEVMCRLENLFNLNHRQLFTMIDDKLFDTKRLNATVIAKSLA